MFVINKSIIYIINTFFDFASLTHRIFEAIVFVDVTSVGGQFNAMAQTNSPPLDLSEFRDGNAVHLPGLTVFIHHCLLTKAQTPIILWGELTLNCVCYTRITW